MDRSHVDNGPIETIDMMSIRMSMWDRHRCGRTRPSLEMHVHNTNARVKILAYMPAVCISRTLVLTYFGIDVLLSGMSPVQMSGLQNAIEKPAEHQAAISIQASWKRRKSRGIFAGTLPPDRLTHANGSVKNECCWREGSHTVGSRR